MVEEYPAQTSSTSIPARRQRRVKHLYEHPVIQDPVEGAALAARPQFAQTPLQHDRTAAMLSCHGNLDEILRSRSVIEAHDDAQLTDIVRWPAMAA